MEHTEKKEQKVIHRWRRWLLIGIPVAIITAVFLPIASAFGGWFGKDFCMRRHGNHFFKSDKELYDHIEGHLDYILDLLETNDRQKAAIHQIVRDSSKEVLSLHKRGQELHKALGQALLGDPIDKHQLDQLRSEWQELSEEVGELMVDRLVSIAEELTPDQREKLHQFIEEKHRFHQASID